MLMLNGIPQAASGKAAAEVGVSDEDEETSSDEVNISLLSSHVSGTFKHPGKRCQSLSSASLF